VLSIQRVPAGALRFPGIAQPMPEHCVVTGQLNEHRSPVRIVSSTRNSRGSLLLSS